ncbi:sperm flagellar protein 2 isoform X6 [Motacilla alba alba]|uniref:sperm flagellar protein 2 isoform X6 n=1 Tax=Motacilla alba alba TaxID=1094192 RepID=UPI0018D5A277|nr:sperm flagellar protein 2 isoform X6 [Motacilla alba alba]
MSQILCEWLNRDVKLSRRIVPGSFPEEFSTGYLLGELLHKYGLQDDFKQFSQNRGADAKINNFSRLEPTLHLLGVQFNENMAQDIMTRQHGAATKLLYELYIALEKKKKAKLSGVAVGAMRPAATAKLTSTESGNQEHYIGRRQNEIMARIQTAVIQTQKQPSRPTIRSFEAKRFLKKKREAENVYKEIEKFEKSMTGKVSAVHGHVTGSDMQELLQTQKFQEASLETIPETRTELLNIYSDDEYIRKIQKRVQEDRFAREQRAKRRRKMLVDQLAAHEAQEKVYREEQLIYRLMKQSQHERRIAAQLMHVRHEKEVLRQNRIFREKQYEERRQKDFQEALDREASMTGEWSPTEENSEKKPPLNNNILGHVLRRLMEMFYPPKPKSSREFPSFPIKGCVLGKMFSGKTTCAKFVEKVCNIQVLSVGTLVQEAIEAFLNNEMKSEPSIISQEAESSAEQNEFSQAQENLLNSPTNLLEELQTESTTELTTEPILDNCPVENDPSQDEIQEELELDNSQDGLSKLSVRAQFGAASQKWLKNGKSVPDELLIDILLEAITQIPPEKGWIVEGFPMTINQAKLFEKSYSGIDVEAKDPISEKLSLAIDPRAPNQPPPTSPAFDVSILLDISDSLVLKRAANVKLNERKASQAEQGSNQNSDAEILEEKVDLAREQVLHRISGFLKTWPKLEKWFSVHQNNLVKVNAEMEESLVCETVKEIIIEEIVKNQNRRSAEEIRPEEEILPITEEEDVLPVTEEQILPVTDEEEKDLPVIDQSSPLPEAPPMIEPGSDEWIYVDEPLPQEIIDFLVPYWEMVENTYMNTIKTVLRCLRDEQYTIIHYTADIRKKFKDFLKRPHLKQEFVSQWQADFNSIADELQDDEETKAELHQRVTDLRDLLWDICDIRREEAELERTGIMNEEWLPDRRGIAMNHFFTLMQVELDRFQDTKRLLHDYYRAMEGKIPTEDTQDFTRIPLLDIINGEQKEDQDEPRRIPLVSWKPPSPGNTESEKSGTKKKSLKDNSSENGVTTCRDDKSLVIGAWQTAVTAVSDMVTAEIEFREMEEETERQLKQKSSKAAQKQPGNTAGKDTKGAKNASSKSPPKKKGAKAAPAPIDPEELRKEELALKIKQEYFSALKHEEAATKSRLELIKEKALAFLEDLKFKAEEAYKDMEKWLGSTFLEEKSSVEKLVEVARHHIESSSKILYEITLEGTDFFINSDVKMVPDPVPDPDPPPEFQHIETSGGSTLTISQLTTLHKQFLQLAPKGFITKKVFIETVSGLVNLNLGINCYPDAWKNLTLADLENLASEFTVNSHLTDWRRFLLAAAQPWPVPSVTQLLQTLHGFKSVDVTGSGFITQELYLQVGLWFNGSKDLSITESYEEPVSLERLKHLIEFFFHLFVDTKKDPALLDYIAMLLYFASHSDPVEGVHRALSIVTGEYIHRKKKAALPCVDSSSPNIMPNEKILIEDEKEVLNYTGEGIISVASLLKVFHTGGSKDDDYHRFSCLEKANSYDKHFIRMYQELGAENLTPIAFELLLKHPFMEDLINTCQEYKLPDIKVFLQSSKEAQSTDGEQNTCEDINV